MACGAAQVLFGAQSQLHHYEALQEERLHNHYYMRQIRRIERMKQRIRFDHMLDRFQCPSPRPRTHTAPTPFASLPQHAGR